MAIIIWPSMQMPLWRMELMVASFISESSGFVNNGPVVHVHDLRTVEGAISSHLIWFLPPPERQ
jgi:hypothetical protein